MNTLFVGIFQNNPIEFFMCSTYNNWKRLIEREDKESSIEDLVVERDQVK